MSITVDEIITKRVRVLLRDIDTGGVQWKDAELISWLNEACSEIARIRPESSSTTVDFALAVGTKQAVPTGASMLLELVCNVDPTDGSEGRVVRRVERMTLDSEDPDWMTGTPQAVIYRYVASQTDPRTFYVYPPSQGGANRGVRAVVAMPPAAFTLLTAPFPLPDVYASVAANYVLGRAFAKLSESASAQDKAAYYHQLFESQMGVSDSVMEGRNAKVREPTIPRGPVMH